MPLSRHRPAVHEPPWPRPRPGGASWGRPPFDVPAQEVPSMSKSGPEAIAPPGQFASGFRGWALGLSVVLLLATPYVAGTGHETYLEWESALQKLLATPWFNQAEQNRLRLEVDRLRRLNWQLSVGTHV